MIRAVVRRNRFAQIASKLTAAAEDVVNDHAEQVKTEAVAVVPVDTGNLRDHISVETYAGFTTAMVHTSGVPYAPRIEFGFVGRDSLGRYYNQAAQPYMTPAGEIVRPRFVAAMSRLEPLLR